MPVRPAAPPARGRSRPRPARRGRARRRRSPRRTPPRRPRAATGSVVTRAGERERRPATTSRCRVSVDRRRPSDAGLAVVDVPQDAPLGGAAARARSRTTARSPGPSASGRTAPSRRGAARRAGSSAVDGPHGHPFTDPCGQAADDPASGGRGSRSATGTAAISAPAVNGPQVWSYWLLTSSFMPTGQRERVASSGAAPRRSRTRSA